ncbi:adenylyl cyclase CyaB [Catenulispora acidiphila DSM 44928]|uniref:Adenylyl cyclase CyaB n=1 Tax=Catenulispora acidiphila (strain DSM 44928 / JCM 14897 / NBRC 102108 / NRRL B-24433 / ID139908) TaxID=479433 RepID=C7Q154_CATAD|nr:class IV adenylate cyclase [Catenulispora acidiphila]ACU71729.1 adenylyl cyclase CyaB [Catenulispora acidiphila DSM 44928]
MSIEAELKARVGDPQTVRAGLASRADVTQAVYHDTYYDRAGDGFMSGGRELRLRTIETQDSVRHLLTFKAPAVDEASGSKPEFETEVADPEAVAAILEGLGYRPALTFSKRCENFEFEHDGHPMLATLVTVPEIEGTFLEVETVVEQEDGLSAALDAVRGVLHELGINDDDLTTELYTDAVKRSRGA